MITPVDAAPTPHTESLSSAPKYAWAKSILFVQNYQGTGGTENIGNMLAQHNSGAKGAQLKLSNATLIDVTLKGDGSKFPLHNHITQTDQNGITRTTLEVIAWDSNSNFSDIQSQAGRHIGRGPFGLAIEKICLKNYFLNLGHKTTKSETTTNAQSNANRLDGVLIKSPDGFELNPSAIATMKEAIEDAAPHVVYVAQDHATTLVTEAIKQLNDVRPIGERIGIVYGIHREDLSVEDTLNNEKDFCVATNMRASYGAIQVAVVCSRSAGQNYASVGGNPYALKEVENGTDCEKFARNDKARHQFREQHDIPQGAKVITLAGRYSPEKDMTACIRIISEVLQRPGNEAVHFVGCGAMLSSDNRDLQNLLKNTLGDLQSLKERIHFLGFQDMPAVMSATDIVLSTSRTESWGLTLLEAAAAGCIAVYSDLHGTRNAMGRLAEDYSLCVKRQQAEKPDPLFPNYRMLSDESIGEFVDKLQEALALSEDPEARQAHLDRARETDISKMYDGYLEAFQQAYQKANSTLAGFPA
ncbi:glycosyltransferase family 4 protein [Pseudomonas sp. R3-56]|uniref:glycosyltransferase family 4 protein n=1 Tax=Pseudomonas sp. R3-56 TaxID=2817401 RepID=UPI003DAA1C5A